MGNTTDSGARRKVWEMIKDIRTAQLVTHSGNGRLSARPMQALNREFNGSLWFFTVAHSPKIGEILNNPNVLLSYSDDGRHNYVSVQGKAAVLNDREKIKDLWVEMARIWFPEGADDPNIRLIRVDVDRAEYWDSPSQSLVLLYGYARARLIGDAPDMGENKKVEFR